MMVTSSVIRSWCRPTCTKLTMPMTKLVEYFNAASPKMKDRRGANAGLCQHGGSPKQYAGSYCGTVPVHHGSLPGRSRRHPRSARTISVVPGPTDRIFSPTREPRRQQNQPHPSGAWPHCSSRKAERQKYMMRLDRRSLNGFFPGVHGGQFRASCTQCWPVGHWVQEGTGHCQSGTSKDTLLQPRREFWA